ncbi:MAG: tetratricopeptide (TPR) repeat protein, partial [Flavobacteriales bacterium]
MKILRCTIFALIALFAVSCATSKSFYKKGKKLEEAGMLEEAASMYMTSLQKNTSNIDARIGMKASGQIVMNKLLQEFVQLKQFGEKKQAVKAYELAVSYHQKVQRLGVELQFPDFYKADFQQLKEEYTIELYHAGLDLMDQGKYAAAEANFKEIERLDPEHSDASDLADIAYAEPLYKKAVKAYDLMEYRGAHNNFKLVVDRIPSYKEASQLKAAALQNGLFTIAMLPFKNATSSAGLEAKVEAYSLEALIGV